MLGVLDGEMFKQDVVKRGNDGCACECAQTRSSNFVSLHVSLVHV